MIRGAMFVWVMVFGRVIYPCLAAAPPAVLTALTAGEIQKLDAARAAVKSDPAVKDAQEKFNAARKAYQLDRAKFPADRDKNVSIEYRKQTKALEDATRQAMIARDPAIAELFKKQPPKRNEGENATDSDTGNKAAVKPIEDVPGLPRVLLIGDSISIGYTLQVRQKLKGKANVHRIPVNGGATEVGLANMAKWLGEGKWDVIHFNFGLHDAKYMSESTQRATREVYIEHLRRLIAQMKATGAKLIFATTTPTPEELSRGTRKFDSIPARNELAVKLMQESGVAVDDLYAVVLPVMTKIQRPKDVHFTPEGYEILSKAVAESIAKQLQLK